MAKKTLKDLNQDIAEALSHARDVSVRDGNQSLDANMWRVEELVEISKGLASLQEILLRGYGYKLPDPERAGGGNFQQPAKFRRLDPFLMLKALDDAAPNLGMHCLNRGRQCYGYEPVSPEIIEFLIRTAVASGVTGIRVFDMMNDIRNLEASVDAILKINSERKKAGLKPITIEGATSYISEPEGRKRAWELSEYADYTVEIAKLVFERAKLIDPELNPEDFFETVIKNYAGVGEKEMPALIKAMRVKLDAAGFSKIPVNLHIHGEKAECLAEVLEPAVGAKTVDVAIGQLANGPSHTDVIDFLKARLKKRGYNIESRAFAKAFDDNDLVIQIRKIEQVIEQGLARHEGMFAKRLGKIAPEETERYRMAGGAFADLNNRIVKLFNDSEFPFIEIGKVRRENKQEFFKEVLEKALLLWEAGGHYNTVTPGAKIGIDQALVLMFYEFRNKKAGQDAPMEIKDFPLSKFIPEYRNLLTGMYGRNQGMEKGIGDTKLRDTFLMHRTLKKINGLIQSGQLFQPKEGDPLGQLERWKFDGAADLGAPKMPGKDIPKEPMHPYRDNDGTLHFAPPHMPDKAMPKEQMRLTINSDGTYRLNDEDIHLHRILRNSDIEKFRKAIQGLNISHELKQELLTETMPERSPNPTAGLKEGYEMITNNINSITTLHVQGEISSVEVCAAMALQMRNRIDGDSIFFGMLNAKCQAKNLVSFTADLRARAGGEELLQSATTTRA